MSVCSTLCEVMSYISAECLVDMFLFITIYIYVCRHFVSLIPCTSVDAWSNVTVARKLTPTTRGDFLRGLVDGFLPHGMK